MVSVAIFDYGAGNIFSLKNSLEKVGATVDVITNFDNENTYSGLRIIYPIVSEGKALMITRN